MRGDVHLTCERLRVFVQQRRRALGDVDGDLNHDTTPPMGPTSAPGSDGPKAAMSPSWVLAASGLDSFALVAKLQLGNPSPGSSSFLSYSHAVSTSINPSPPA
jgi:hypothetical protein